MRGGRSITSDESHSNSLLPANTDPLSLILNDVALGNAIHTFAKEGYPYIQDLITALYSHRDKMPYDLQVGIFGIVGRYLHTFSSIITHGDYHFSTAHQMAIVEVMSDPAVTKMVEEVLHNFLLQTVSYFGDGEE